MSLDVSSRAWLEEEEEIRARLIDLRDNYAATSLKVSTEDAGMSFDEIRQVYRMFNDILPIQAKIGGPEARNDMREVIDIGCRAIIGPMIESPFSLEKYIQSAKEVLGEKHYRFIDKHINIETVTAVDNIDNILSIPEAEELTQITIGRTDLCRSLSKPPEHQEVMTRVRDVVEAAHLKGLRVSVGGRITPKDAVAICNMCAPDRLNTRDIGFDAINCDDIEETVAQLIDFEIAVLEHQKTFGRRVIGSLQKRITKLHGRKNR